MPLDAGTRIANYEIIGPLGAGGMGEVYRARDTRLHRDVAIKSVSREFSDDRERLARFEREATLLASLNHPNIAGIYGIEDLDGTSHLVLEFVDGETLEQRLRRGVLAVGETLEVAGQIASGIEAAHDGGIIHRDLKPGNVMLTRSGVVKVLDFGLSKSEVADQEGATSQSASPTMAIGATGAGVVLGTAPYMSPEQARGKPVDRRADVWALGCIIYECLSRSQTFSGETVSDVIARILEREPDWSLLPGATPQRLTELIRKCLSKDLNARPKDVGDLRLELLAIAQNRSAPKASSDLQKPSLAVLYFENMTSDSESDYFCAGITEDILADLSKIKGLNVASRNAVLRYRREHPEIAEVCAELNVKAVLQGSVRRSGDRVRITTQLNGPDGFQLWAERYDRTMQDVFAVQEEIASSIAEALRVTLTPSEANKLGQDRPSDAQAYDLYLKGREQYVKYTKESLEQALSLFRQAIEIDADYALAWAGVADCYGQLIQWGLAADVEKASRLGLEAVQRAIEINPGLPHAYKAEALVREQSGDLEGSRVAIEKAVQADPNFTPALMNLAVMHFFNAHIASSERITRRILELDPQEPFAIVWLGFMLLYSDRPDEALAVAARVRELTADGFYRSGATIVIAWSHMRRDDDEAAAKAVRDGAAEGVPSETLKCIEALLAARAGDEATARGLIDEVAESPVLRSEFSLVGAVMTVIGDHERAVAYLQAKLTIETAATVRVVPELMELAGLPALAPRRWDKTLVWPLEAPKIDVARYRLFEEVKIETGLPQGSDIHAT